VQGGPEKNPCLTAIEEDGMDYCLVEFGNNRLRSIFTPKNLPDLSPGGAGLPKLSADGLNVVVILRQKMPKVWLECFSRERMKCVGVVGHDLWSQE
jgi:hypothetical protein